MPSLKISLINTTPIIIRYIIMNKIFKDIHPKHDKYNFRMMYLFHKNTTISIKE